MGKKSRHRARDKHYEDQDSGKQQSASSTQPDELGETLRQQCDSSPPISPESHIKTDHEKFDDPKPSNSNMSGSAVGLAAEYYQDHPESTQNPSSDLAPSDHADSKLYHPRPQHATGSAECFEPIFPNEHSNHEQSNTNDPSQTIGGYENASSNVLVGLDGSNVQQNASFLHCYPTSTFVDNRPSQSSLLHNLKQKSPLQALAEFWKDADGVAQFEEYSEAIGICRHCFQPGSTYRDAPRDHCRLLQYRGSGIDSDGSIHSSTAIAKYSSKEDGQLRRDHPRGSAKPLRNSDFACRGFKDRALCMSSNSSPSKHNQPAITSDNRGTVQMDRHDENLALYVGGAMSMLSDLIKVAKDIGSRDTIFMGNRDKRKATAGGRAQRDSSKQIREPDSEDQLSDADLAFNSLSEKSSQESIIALRRKDQDHHVSRGRSHNYDGQESNGFQHALPKKPQEWPANQNRGIPNPRQSSRGELSEERDCNPIGRRLSSDSQSEPDRHELGITGLKKEQRSDRVRRRIRWADHESTSSSTGREVKEHSQRLRAKGPVSSYAPKPRTRHAARLPQRVEDRTTRAPDDGSEMALARFQDQLHDKSSRDAKEKRSTDERPKETDVNYPDASDVHDLPSKIKEKQLSQEDTTRERTTQNPHFWQSPETDTPSDSASVDFGAIERCEQDVCLPPKSVPRKSFQHDSYCDFFKLPEVELDRTLPPDNPNVVRQNSHYPPPISESTNLFPRDYSSSEESSSANIDRSRKASKFIPNWTVPSINLIAPSPPASPLPPQEKRETKKYREDRVAISHEHDTSDRALSRHDCLSDDEVDQSPIVLCGPISDTNKPRHLDKHQQEQDGQSDEALRQIATDDPTRSRRGSHHCAESFFIGAVIASATAAGVFDEMTQTSQKPRADPRIPRQINGVDAELEDVTWRNLEAIPHKEMESFASKGTCPQNDIDPGALSRLAQEIATPFTPSETIRVTNTDTWSAGNVPQHTVAKDHHPVECSNAQGSTTEIEAGLTSHVGEIAARHSSFDSSTRISSSQECSSVIGRRLSNRRSRTLDMGATHSISPMGHVTQHQQRRSVSMDSFMSKSSPVPQPFSRSVLRTNVLQDTPIGHDVKDTTLPIDRSLTSGEFCICPLVLPSASTHKPVWQPGPVPSALHMDRWLYYAHDANHAPFNRVNGGKGIFSPHVHHFQQHVSERAVDSTITSDQTSSGIGAPSKLQASAISKGSTNKKKSKKSGKKKIPNPRSSGQSSPKDKSVRIKSPDQIEIKTSKADNHDSAQVAGSTPVFFPFQQDDASTSWVINNRKRYDDLMDQLKQSDHHKDGCSVSNPQQAPTNMDRGPAVLFGILCPERLISEDGSPLLHAPGLVDPIAQNMEVETQNENDQLQEMVGNGRNGAYAGPLTPPSEMASIYERETAKESKREVMQKDAATPIAQENSEDRVTTRQDKEILQGRKRREHDTNGASMDDDVCGVATGQAEVSSPQAFPGSDNEDATIGHPEAQLVLSSRNASKQQFSTEPMETSIQRTPEGDEFLQSSGKVHEDDMNLELHQAAEVSDSKPSSSPVHEQYDASQSQSNSTHLSRRLASSPSETEKMARSGRTEETQSDMGMNGYIENLGSQSTHGLTRVDRKGSFERAASVPLLHDHDAQNAQNVFASRKYLRSHSSEQSLSLLLKAEMDRHKLFQDAAPIARNFGAQLSVGKDARSNAPMRAEFGMTSLIDSCDPRNSRDQRASDLKANSDEGLGETIASKTIVMPTSTQESQYGHKADLEDSLTTNTEAQCANETLDTDRGARDRNVVLEAASNRDANGPMTHKIAPSLRQPDRLQGDQHRQKTKKAKKAKKHKSCGKHTKVEMAPARNGPDNEDKAEQHSDIHGNFEMPNHEDIQDGIQPLGSSIAPLFPHDEAADLRIEQAVPLDTMTLEMASEQVQPRPRQDIEHLENSNDIVSGPNKLESTAAALKSENNGICNGVPTRAIDMREDEETSPDGDMSDAIKQYKSDVLDEDISMLQFNGTNAVDSAPSHSHDKMCQILRKSDHQPVEGSEQNAASPQVHGSIAEASEVANELQDEIEARSHLAIKTSSADSEPARPTLKPQNDAFQDYREKAEDGRAAFYASQNNPITPPASACASPSPSLDSEENEMAELEGIGAGDCASLIPSRPPSVRKRQSIIHAETQQRLAQLTYEYELSERAKQHVEQQLEQQSRDHQDSRQAYEEAIDSHKTCLVEREQTLNQLSSLVDSLREENSVLSSQLQRQLASNESSVAELREMQLRQEEYAREQEDLQTQLHESSNKIEDLQGRLAALRVFETLVERDEDYFESRCEDLFHHLTSWVVRYSKLSDHERCFFVQEIDSEAYRALYREVMLDDLNVDDYLQDRQKRRLVLVSVIMSLLFKYIFTRYLFGMDRDHRQKLKSLDKSLQEVCPMSTVQRWRAITLALLSRQPAFQSQRDLDSNAVMEEVWDTLASVLPLPESSTALECRKSLRRLIDLAVTLSIEMRLQSSEYVMLPPPNRSNEPEGGMLDKYHFMADSMTAVHNQGNHSDEELEEQGASLRLVMFPLVAKTVNDQEQVVVYRAQVHVNVPA